MQISAKRLLKRKTEKQVSDSLDPVILSIGLSYITVILSAFGAFLRGP